MSAHAAAPPGPAPRRALAAPAVAAPVVLRLCAFFALAAFASIAYGELVLHPPAGRLIAVAAVATAGCAALAVRRGDGRALLPGLVRPLLVVAVLVLALLVSGLPAHLLAPAHWGRLGRDVGHGVDGLGEWLWPYRGASAWSRLDVVLVVPVVLVTAAATCFWPDAGSRAQGLGLGLLVALFLTGAANTPQSQPGLRGLVLLALLAAWIWTPTAGRQGGMRAARWLLAPALLALALRPALASTHPWIGFREASGGSAGEASFQWDQTYGPITWPQTGATMFTISEPHAELLRITSLDRFDGLRFLRSAEPPGSASLDMPHVLDPRRLSHATVTIAGLRSTLLVGGDGLPQAMSWLGRGAPVVSREADGTLAGAETLSDGAYGVTTYRPPASPAVLRRAPRRFPRAYLPYAQFELPTPSASGLIQPHFATESRVPAASNDLVGPSAPGRAPADDAAVAARIASSPYGQMFGLAQRLAAGAPSAYDVAVRIERYLLTNYRYDLHVPQARYPLEAFLFEQRRGYCQQFSGAMTLLLRMDGIPARVASGFKPDLYNPVSGVWTVRALDAHSWVEVFFAGVGWVSFDPTPAAPIVVGGSAAPSTSKSEVVASSAVPAAAPANLVSGGAAAAGRGGGLSGAALALAAAGAALLALAGLWLRGHLRLRHGLAGTGAAAVAELERALGCSGAGARGETLAQLERRLREGGEDDAADYLLALRERRYGAPATGSARPAPRGRAALRRALRRRGSRRTALTLLAAMPPGAMRGTRGRRGAPAGPPPLVVVTR